MISNFAKDYNFLDEHPAFCEDFTGCLCIMVVEVCKNGHALSDHRHKYITKYSDDENFKYFWDKSDECMRRYEHVYIGDELTEVPWTVDIDYEELYGYPYEIDHTEVWLELGPKRLVRSKKKHQYGNYEKWHDIDLDVGARTFEEAIGLLAKKVKDKYGDYSIDSITPNWIKENNDKHLNEFGFDTWFTPVEGTDHSVYSPPKDLVLVGPAEMNELWWQTHMIKKYPNFCSKNFKAQNIDWVLAPLEKK